MNTDRAQHAGRLLLRLALASVFFAHGWMKFAVMGVPGVTGFFTKLGIPLAGLSAWAVVALECGGSLAVAIGLFTRPIAALFAVEMLGAIGFAAFPKGFVGGWELEFTLAAASAALAVLGGGAWGLDAALRLGKNGS